MDNLTDTHCHLDFRNFDEDRDEVIQHAVRQGVSRLLNPGIDLASSRKAVAIAGRYPEIFAAVGVHPNSANTWNKDTRNRLCVLSREHTVVAIGEIGLDYYRDRAPRDLQEQIFKLQLELAAEVGKPVVIHNREASDDLLHILADWHANLVESEASIRDRPGVLHSFSGNEDHAAEAMAHNFFLGITGPVTFKKALDLQRLVAELPLASLLIETDAPFLSPQPRRGRRNEPANVQWVAQKVAELKGVDVGVVRQQTYENAARLFGW